MRARREMFRADVRGELARPDLLVTCAKEANVTEVTSNVTDAKGTLAKFLWTIPIFESLDERQVERVASGSHERQMPKGAAICREGEPTPGFWIVRQGSVNVFKVGPDGKVRILETCGPWDCFGLVSVVDGGSVPANAETRQASTVILVPRATVLATIDEAPRFALAIAALFASRLRRATCQVAAACLQSTRARVAQLLVEEARANGRPLPDGRIGVRLPASQEELAHRIGTEREVFARSLRSLRNDAIIEQVRETVTILDPERLKSVAGEP